LSTISAFCNALQNCSCTFPFLAKLGKRIFLLNALFPHAPEVMTPLQFIKSEEVKTPIHRIASQFTPAIHQKIGCQDTPVFHQI
jgi:hypothetical protein